jgi:hypothetical protein
MFNSNDDNLCIIANNHFYEKILETEPIISTTLVKNNEETLSFYILLNGKESNRYSYCLQVSHLPETFLEDNMFEVSLERYKKDCSHANAEPFDYPGELGYYPKRFENIDELKVEIEILLNILKYT